MSNAVSAKWRPALEADELKVTAWVELWSAPYPHGRFLAFLPLVAGTGSVTSDHTSSIRHSLSGLQTTPRLFDALGLPVPSKPGDALFPVGPEVHVYKGLEYAGGGRLRNGRIGEAFRIFTGLIEHVSVVDDPSGSLAVSVAGRDRSAYLARAGFAEVFSTDGTSPLDVQVRQIRDALPLVAAARDMSWGFYPGPRGWPVPTKASFAVGDDGWQGIVDMCAGVGYEALNNVHGDFEIKQPDDPARSPVRMEYVEGRHCVVEQLERAFDISSIPNAIVLTSSGSNVSPVLRSAWWDSDPKSPTFYGRLGPPHAPTGRYPTMISNQTTSFANTQDDLDDAVRILGLQSRNAFDTISLTELHDAARQVEDVVRVTRKVAGLDAIRYSIDTTTISLDYASADQLTGRRVTWATS